MRFRKTGGRRPWGGDGEGMPSPYSGLGLMALRGRGGGKPPPYDEVAVFGGEGSEVELVGGVAVDVEADGFSHHGFGDAEPVCQVPQLRMAFGDGIVQL